MWKRGEEETNERKRRLVNEGKRKRGKETRKNRWTEIWKMREEQAKRKGAMRKREKRG